MERLHRLHGTSLILDACQLLNLSCYASATTIFHRFYHRVSLKTCCVWTAAMASIVLAAKVEEVAIALRNVIATFSHLYRRRRLLVSCDQSELRAILSHPSVAASSVMTETASWTNVENERAKLVNVPPILSPKGPIYKDWFDAIIDTENQILRQLGFTLHWIPDHRPHKFLSYFLLALQIDDELFTQSAWNYCNDSCRLDLCVRYQPEVIACATLYATALEFRWELPMQPEPWWAVFCGGNCDRHLFRAVNTILGLVDKANLDVCVASKAFVRSLVDNGSFVDPDHFIWFTLEKREGGEGSLTT